jgi:hypothetical protein
MDDLWEEEILFSNQFNRVITVWERAVEWTGLIYTYAKSIWVHALSKPQLLAEFHGETSPSSE